MAKNRRRKRPSAAAVGRSSGVAYPFVDGLSPLSNPIRFFCNFPVSKSDADSTEQEKRHKLSTLSKDMFDLSLDLDNHFLKACTMFSSLKKLPNTVNKEVIAFKNRITAYESKVRKIGHKTDYADAITTTSEALACITFLYTVWGSVTNYLSRLPNGYNNKPPWTTWVSTLNDITKKFPDLLARIWANPETIYTPEQWKEMAAKVAFLDSTIDFAFTNEYARFGTRDFHIGTETNKAIKTASLFANDTSNSLFQEDTPNNPKYGTWKDQLASPIKNESAFIKFAFWLGLLTFAAAAVAIPGWKKSSNDAGKLFDGGHWFLIQTCILQCLGIFTTIFTSQEKFGKTLWTLTACSLICSVVAPFIYTASPIPWSATVAFGGAALSNFVIQYTLLLPAHTKSHTS